MTRLRLLVILLLIIVASVGGIGVLYFIARQSVPLGGGFTRVFLSTHELVAEDTIRLGYDSYYLAGKSGHTVYFGNKVGPRHVLGYDMLERDTMHLLLRVVNRDSVLFHELQLRVDSPMFFLYDGSVPIVFRGGGMKAGLVSEQQAASYFVTAVPRDDDFLFVYGYDEVRRGRVGILQVSTGETVFPSSLLSTEGDGVFALDGMMHYDKAQKRFVYLYHYRNEFLVTDSLLNVVRVGHTVDTIRVARIQVARKSDGALVAQGLPLVVNMHSELAGDYLYVHSRAISDQEEAIDFREREVIDVYAYEGIGYVGSFYMRARQHDEIRALAVIEDKLIVLYKLEVVVYSLKEVMSTF